jgi:peptidoglycan/xylan/chitin deacetylase (PgdA/CDA1 family)
MTQITPTGEIFGPDDVPVLLEHGHELGCHTFHHYPAWETAPSIYESSVDRNAASLAHALGAYSLQTHSYPISYPRPSTKRRLQRRFRGCRGGGQSFNQGTVDLCYLKSFFLEQSRDDFATIERLIAANAEAGGWLVFSTHDVCANPTRFGCTPDIFEKVVRSSVRSGAKILLMSAALDTFGVPNLQ